MQNYTYFEEVDSTNNQLKKLNLNALNEFYCIRTGFQSQGRGRGNHAWESNPNENLLMSFVVFPNILAKFQFDISCNVALSIVQTLQQINIKNIKIKWPNDIYVNNKKIAGMLIEHTIVNNFIKNSIVGIGLNVNQTKFSPLLPNPTSIYIETQQENSVEQICFLLLEQFKKNKNVDREFIRNQYTQLLYRKDVFTNYKIKKTNIIIEAKILGIDDWGRVQLQEKSGEIHVFDLNEIEYIL